MSYDVYKRKDGGKYYVRFPHNGKDHNFSLHTTMKVVADKKAKKAYLDIVLANDDSLLGECATIGQILDRYKTYATADGQDKKAIRDNELVLLSIVGIDHPVGSNNSSDEGVRAVTGRYHEKLKGLSTALLTEDIVHRYQMSEIDRGIQRRTINSNLKKARSVFNKYASKHYRSEGLVLAPCIVEFMKANCLRKKAGETDVCYVPIPRSVLQKMEQHFKALKSVNIDIYRAFLLVRCLALRNCELMKLRYSWFECDGFGRWRLRVRKRKNEDFKPKGGQTRNLLLSEALVKELGLCEDDMRFVLGHGLTHNKKTELIYRLVSEEVRKFIPDRVKSLYELRKERGAEIATEFSIYAAKTFLGHSTVATTEKYYAAYLEEKKPIITELPEGY